MAHGSTQIKITNEMFAMRCFMEKIIAGKVYGNAAGKAWFQFLLKILKYEEILNDFRTRPELSDHMTIGLNNTPNIFGLNKI
jgi:hypothetical protein